MRGRARKITHTTTRRDCSVVKYGTENEVRRAELHLREHVLYFDAGVSYYLNGLWDGDDVIPIDEDCADCVEANHGTCAHCKKVKQFNAKQWLAAGEHIYNHRDGYKENHVTHHDIHNGMRYVYHFDDCEKGTDGYYDMRHECKARGKFRRANLKSRKLGSSGIRNSCLYCFSQGKPIDLFEYDASFFSRLVSEQGTCTKASHASGEVVRRAKEFYENNSFGEYSIRHNCRAFAHYCKTECYGTKQVSRALFYTSVLFCEWEVMLAAVATKWYLNQVGKKKIASAKLKASRTAPAAPGPVRIYRCS